MAKVPTKEEMIIAIARSEAVELILPETDELDRIEALRMLHRDDIRDIYAERFPKKDMRRLENKQGGHWLQ